jgi:drug/metabolite transporter (DMT)-like permease
MTQKTKLVLAAIVVALLGVCCVLAPAIGGMFAFVVALTSGVMWLSGFGRTPAFVKRARRAAAERPRQMALEHPEVVEREYPVVAKRLGVILSYAVGLFFLVPGLLVLASAPFGKSKDRAVVVVLGAVVAAFGVFMTWFAYRVSRIKFRVSPRGLYAEPFFGRREIAWDDIVAVGHTTYRQRGQVTAEQDVVYSMDASISIPSQVAGHEELMATIWAEARNVVREG